MKETDKAIDVATLIISANEKVPKITGNQTKEDIKASIYVN
ncbi:hypothetical protein [Halosquirtibacter laminarini]